MRLCVSSLGRIFNRDLPIEFGSETLSSYGGLELLRRYFQLIGLHRRIRRAFADHDLGGDYGCVRLVLLVIGLLVVGARRLEHVRYVAGDPLFLRLCGLARVPSDRTVVNWLKKFTQRSLQALISLNTELLHEQIEQLGLRRLTIDVDGTVIRTGGKVAFAVRGYNPHHPKDPSYYPLLAHIAQTSQILRIRNRPGNINDSRGARAFLTEIVGELRGRFGRSMPLEFRMDGAFFQENILKLLDRLGCSFAIKVPFWKWLPLRSLVAAQKRWTRLDSETSCFETEMPIAQWGLSLRVVVYRERVHHRSPRNYQLDLFDPDDGYFEYSAITTNKPLAPRALWDFMAGRGAHEKMIGELKGEFGLDVVPTNHYGANSAWQQLSILAHNLIRGFQLHSTLATPNPRSAKCTALYRLMSMRTLRFLVIARAARVARIAGRKVLRFAHNSSTQILYDQVAYGLTE